jgi:uncharacterized protein (DUF1800 family)
MATVETQVGHVWRRLGFGPVWSDIVSGVAVPVPQLIDSLIDRPFVTFATAMPQGMNQQENDNVRRLLENMAFGPNERGSTTTAASYNPVQERVTWMLQGLLVVGMDVADLANMRDHLLYLRGGIRSTYRHLVTDIAARPGMLRYLTGDQNQKGHPNENFAREFCELFTLGIVNPATGVTNYTQQDIVEIARAMTGWKYNWNTWSSYFDANSWDNGSKTIFGVDRGAADLNGTAAAIASHPSWRTFVPARIYQELTGFTASPQVLSELSPVWGSEGDIKGLVRHIAKRPEFISDACILNKVKSPVERLVAATRLLSWPGLVFEPNLIWLLSEMGQHPFYPPNVSGWARGDQWLNTTSLQNWCSLANLMAMRGFNWQGVVTGTINPGVEALFSNASSATATDYVLARAGLRGITSQKTFNALDAYAKAGLWNRYRAAGLLNLLLMSPEFLAN